MFENPRRGRQARNFTTNVPKILDLKSSSEQMFSENCRWVPLDSCLVVLKAGGDSWHHEQLYKQTEVLENNVYSVSIVIKEPT